MAFDMVLMLPSLLVDVFWLFDVAKRGENKGRNHKTLGINSKLKGE